MNYRHAYHAGNFADVLKHVVETGALEHLKRKEAPLFYLDTHAGRGRYRRDDPAMQQGKEFLTGIVPVLAAARAPALVARYLEVVRADTTPAGELASYPGSPLLAQALLRAQDRGVLCELEASELTLLRQALGRDPRFHLHQRDGYEALGALLPPEERRGLVLIDPPYEDAAEFSRLADGLRSALSRWPTGVVLAWYPLARRGGSAGFLRNCQAELMRPALVAELTLRPADSPVGLYGAGVLLINPPWQLDAALAEALAWLAGALGPQARFRLDWLVPE
jgi:23S rRNA (adenine2030-N6)-methyltransferase